MPLTTQGRSGSKSDYARRRAKRGKATTRRALRRRLAPSLPLAARLLDRNGLLAVGRVANAFGMSKVQLAETIGLRRETFYKASRVRAPKTQARLREMLEIVSLVSDWAGGRDQAMAWYRAQPLPAFGGRTAEALVKSGKAAALRDYVDHIALGGFT